MRKTRFFLLGLSLLALTGCDLPYRQYSPITKEDSSYNISDGADFRTTQTHFIYPPEGYALKGDYSPEQAAMGHVRIVQWANGKFGEMSLYDGSIIVPAIYDVLLDLPSKDNGYYVKALRSSGTFDVYDYRGYRVAQNVSNDSTFAIYAESLALHYGKKHLVETIVIDGKQTRQEILLDRQRKALVIPPDLLIKDADGYWMPGSGDGKELGFPSYDIEVTKSGIFSLNFNHKEVASFTLPEENWPEVFTWKCFIHQEDNVTKGSLYTYIADGEKHLVKTYQTQLATAKVVTIDCPYVLRDLVPFYDDEGITHFFKAKARAIIDHSLSDKEKVLIFDNIGRVIYDATEDGIYDDDAEFLSWDRVYSPTHHAMFNENLDWVNDVSSTAISPACRSKTFLTQNEKSMKFGVISFDNATIFSNKYDTLSLPDCVDRYAFASLDGAYYSLDLANHSEAQCSVPAGSVLTDLNDGFVRVLDSSASGQQECHYYSYGWDELSFPSWPQMDATFSLDTFYDDLVVDAFHSTVQAAPICFQSFWVVES
jgi:hypothetical protein